MGSRPDQDRAESERRERMDALEERLASIANESEDQHAALLETLRAISGSQEMTPPESSDQPRQELRGRVHGQLTASRDVLSARRRHAAEKLRHLERRLHELEVERRALRDEERKLRAMLAEHEQAAEVAVQRLSERDAQLAALQRDQDEQLTAARRELATLGDAMASAQDLAQQVGVLQAQLEQSAAREAELGRQLEKRRERAVTSEEPRPSADAERGGLARELVRSQQRLAHQVDELERVRTKPMHRLAEGAWRMRRRLAISTVALTVIACILLALLAHVGWWIFVALVPLVAAAVLALCAAHLRRSRNGYRARPHATPRSLTAAADEWMIPVRVREAVPPWSPLEAPAAGADPSEPKTPAAAASPSHEILDRRVIADGASALGLPDPPSDLAAAWLGEPRLPDLAQLRVAVIAPPDVQDRLKTEVALLVLDPEHWEDQLGDATPEVLLVAPGHGRTDLDGWPAEALDAVLHWSGDQDMATVLWDTVGATAAPLWARAGALDCVFATDAPRMAAYRETGARDIAQLAPAAQPRLVVPRLSDEGLRGPCLLLPQAPSKDELQAAIEAAAAATRRHGLSVYGTAEMPTGFETESHVNFIRCDDRVTAVRRAARHPVAIECSGRGAPPECAEEALELALAGVVLTSRECPPVEALMGEHLVVADSAAALGSAVDGLLRDEKHRARSAELARLHVLAHHTHRQRLEAIASRVGVPVTSGRQEAITLLVPAGQCAEPLAELALVDMIQRQTAPPMEVLVQRDDLRDRIDQGAPGVRVRHVDVDPGTQAEVLAQLGARATAPWLLAYDGRNDHAPTYLESLSATLRLRDDAGALQLLVARQSVLERGWPKRP